MENAPPLAPARPCLDCGKPAQPVERLCAHCGGRLAPPVGRGRLWPLAAVAALAGRGVRRTFERHWPRAARGRGR